MTVAARSAGVLIDDGDLSAFEVLLFQQSGLENQFQVGGVHIRICQDDLVGVVGFADARWAKAAVRLVLPVPPLPLRMTSCFIKLYCLFVE